MGEPQSGTGVPPVRPPKRYLAPFPGETRVPIDRFRPALRRLLIQPYDGLVEQCQEGPIDGAS